MDINERERLTVESPTTSRRAFLATAAGAAGAAGALFGGSAGAVGALLAAPLATSFATARELLYLDGSPFGLLSGRSGGLPFVEFQPPATATEVKSGGIVRFEPLVLQVAAGMPSSLYQWITDSAQLQAVRKSGFIAFIGFDGNEGGRLNFTNALISEITLPALDAASKDSLALTITLVPEYTQLFLSPPTPVKHTLPINTKAKSWLGSHFRLKIDKIDAKGVIGVESQTTTIKLAAFQPGVDKFSTKAPTGIENGRFVISVVESDARQFLDWFNQLWGPQGNPNDPALLRSATLEYLSPTLTAVIGAVTFKNVGIAKIEPERVAATDAIRKVRIEMYVGSTTIEAKSFV